MCDNYSSRETRQKLQLWSSLLCQRRGSSPAQGSSTIMGSDLGRYMESGRSRLHTHYEQHIHNGSTNLESSRQELNLLK